MGDDGRVPVGGAFYDAITTDRYGLESNQFNSNHYRIHLDASRSSGLYGKSSTVQPLSCRSYTIIKF